MAMANGFELTKDRMFIKNEWIVKNSKKSINYQVIYTFRRKITTSKEISGMNTFFFV